MRFSLLALLVASPLQALTIQVDYRYDSNDFFDNALAMEAMEAAAARWSRVITTSLVAVDKSDEPVGDIRIGFSHPSTGASYQVSSAASQASDYFVQQFNRPPADEYRGRIEIPADTIILYVGARSLGFPLGVGGSGTGFNFSSVFDDPNSHLNRGFNVGLQSQSVWGGSISFNSDTNNWNFDVNRAPTNSEVDFYSLALHEIGHVLGLATQSSDWEDNVTNGQFTGTNAVTAFNLDNSASRTFLTVQPTGNPMFPFDPHWENDAYRSLVFPFGDPNRLGGTTGLQDLLLDPSANFGRTRRLEITNVDIGGASDAGWSIISSDPMVPTGEAPEVMLSFNQSSGRSTLSFASDSGASYRIQTSLSMEGSWSNVTPLLPSQGSSTSWTEGASGFNDPLSSASPRVRKFFRVIKQ